MAKPSPRLRTVRKSIAPYPENQFSKDFPINVGKQIIYILATRGETDIEGKEWEQIFANAIGAKWKPSNVGLDDIVLGNTAWGAKSVKYKNPSSQKTVRLISGRNDLQYSFNYIAQPGKKADETGEMVLSIYNERVSKIRETYKHLRTVVLIRSYDLVELVIFEQDTIRYDPELYFWKWNKRNNLEGFTKTNDSHKFTWQSGGTQFTIIEPIPNNHLIINLEKPKIVSMEFVFKDIGFNKSWIKVVEKSG